jgi:hypothetical protein
VLKKSVIYIQTLRLDSPFYLYFCAVDTGLPNGIFSYQKSQILVYVLTYFGGPWNGKCWNISWSFGVFHKLLVYFVVIYIYVFPVSHFGVRFLILECCTKNNLATLREYPSWTHDYLLVVRKPIKPYQTIWEREREKSVTSDNAATPLKSEGGKDSGRGGNVGHFFLSVLEPQKSYMYLEA